MRLGGFIITYNRPQILLETIRQVFDQTVPPDLLWIIDNSDNLDTDHAIASLLDPRLNYYRMGYNAGPAGAAMQGLKLCADSGLDWIYWGDDNDPPQHPDTFEKLLSIKDDNPYCGILGAVGHFFDHKKGEIKRVQTRLLERKESLEVEVIAGGMSMLVHKEVVNAGVLPDPDLFFGFEELDFCLKAKRRGFTMQVHCGLFLALRAKHNRTDFERPFYKKKSNPVREYYSLRNLLYISDTLTLDVMKKRLIRKWIGKSIYGFRYGLVYGLKNFRMIWLAFYHYRLGLKGKTIDL
jgi:GT2 family glycosyltransferase